MNEEKIYAFICERFKGPELAGCLDKGLVNGITAMDIEEELGINRNNASTLLNKMVKSHQLIKIDTRPVFFIPRIVIEEYTGSSAIDEVYTCDTFLKKLRCKAEKNDPFTKLIGYDSSLKYQVEQAKAAILYPSNGLHTLIIGESGTGKSLFAKMMHQFGLQAKGTTQEAFPYIEFNCADYYHNPQLLISQLFGHIRGSFTGATEDKVGLVEKADKGILFLDEVHRLSPEGQEMLFFLIDTNRFHRLGEINSNRHANVLIIAATTENPQRALLRTFIRRIPVLIQLPSLREKNVEEKVELIEHLFLKEAAMIKRDIVLHADVIQNLVAKDYLGNIGQMISEIKMLCAQAFLENQNSNEELPIYAEMMRTDAKTPGNETLTLSEIDHKFLNRYHSEVIIKSTSEINYSYGKWDDNRIYSNLREHLKTYTASGIDKKQINEYLREEIEAYYQNMLRRFTRKNMQVNDLYKLIDKEVVDFALEMISDASLKLNIEYSKKSVFGFAFHLKYLLEQIEQRKPLSEPERKYIKSEYEKEYGIAIEIAQKAETRFGTSICEDEKYFLTVLLANTRQDERGTASGIDIIVIAHGDSTASSMVGVCNNLLGTSLVYAVDMPLDRTIEDTYAETLAIVKDTENEHGYILLVDMGSLNGFGLRLTTETGFPTQTIDNVSTLLLLEVARNVLFKNLAIDEIYNNSLNVLDRLKKETVVKPFAILSVCVTGEGVSQAFKNMIETELQKVNLNHIKVFPINFMDVKCKSTAFTNIMNEYELIASIGNVDPKLSVPFFHIEKMLIKSELNEIIQLIDKASKIPGLQSPSIINDPYKESEELLRRYLTYLNPRIAMECGKAFMDNLNLPIIKTNRELMVSLPIHLAFMIERIILGEKPQFEDEEKYIEANKPLYEEIKRGLPILTDRLKNVMVSDADICYIILAINGK